MFDSGSIRIRIRIETRIERQAAHPLVSASLSQSHPAELCGAQSSPAMVAEILEDEKHNPAFHVCQEV